MDKRLKTILPFLDGFTTLYDVGSDHALLPIAALKETTITKAYAIDNKKGPLNQAQKNIEKTPFSNRIEVILSDGLDALKSDVDVVVIAGLGGGTIKTIMQAYQAHYVKRFILSPNTNAHHVRALVNEKNLKITQECYLEQKGVFYPIIILEPGEATLSSDALYLSTFLIEQKDETYHKALLKEKEHLEATLAKIPTKDQQSDLCKQKQRLRRALHAWSED